MRYGCSEKFAVWHLSLAGEDLDCVAIGGESFTRYQATYNYIRVFLQNTISNVTRELKWNPYNSYGDTNIGFFNNFVGYLARCSVNKGTM